MRMKVLQSLWLLLHDDVTWHSQWQSASVWEAQTIALRAEWAIPENIHTPQRTAFWNSEGKGGFFELEFWGQGGVLWTGILKVWRTTYIRNSEGLKMLILWTLPVCKWSMTKRQDSEKHWLICHVLKKVDKTWVVHQIHEFLDDEYQINKMRTDLCLHMYCKHWCSCQDRMDSENSHQSLAFLVRNVC